jgi:hypothetical protein
MLLRDCARLHLSFLVGFGLLAGCGGGRGGDGERDAGPDRDAPRADAGMSAEANIREVLDCAEPTGIFGAGERDQLELHQIDTGRFPDALCNDGTAAVLYYRPYRGEANRNRWAITLRGGGTCGDAALCAARWCGCSAGNPCAFTDIRQGFDANNMSAGGRRGRVGEGIHRRDGARANPIEDYNHVQLIYCSSDEWGGQMRGVELTTTHPTTGEEVTYVAHFLGARILEADIATLRQDGVPALVYTLNGTPVTMPDLDEAESVLIAGDSAGGTGVITHLDAIAAGLRAAHVGGPGPEVRGLIDAVTGPELARLDYTNFVAAASGVDTYEEFLDANAALDLNAELARDASCVAYHEARGNPEICLDGTHVLRHHLTTPFFFRMALLDSLVSRVYDDLGLADPELGPFDLVDGVPRTFAVVLAREMLMMPGRSATSEEGSEMTQAPGIFGPACFDHDTLHVDEEVYDTTITPASAPGPVRLFDVLGPWLEGTEVPPVVSQDLMRRDTACGLR